MTCTIAAGAAACASMVFPQKDNSPRRRSFVLSMAISILTWGMLTRYLPIGLGHYLNIFVVPRSSLQPTLQIGDRILVVKFADYRPQPGNLVVFSVPETVRALAPKVCPREEIFEVKRAIASAGETVKILGRLVFVNDRPLRENYLAAPPA